MKKIAKLADYNSVIKPFHFIAVDRINAELQKLSKDPGTDKPLVYDEDNIAFTLSDVRFENGNICYLYNGKEERDSCLSINLEERKWEENTFKSKWSINFFFRCIRRARNRIAIDIEDINN